MGKSIVIVSGLPRSGTSMLMKMLAAGGLEIVTDNLRKADPDNPKGYYEYEKVKHLQKDSRWVHTMQGKAMIYDGAEIVGMDISQGEADDACFMGGGADNAQIFNFGQALCSVVQQAAFVVCNGIHTQRSEILHGCSQTDTSCDIGCAGFEFGG